MRGPCVVGALVLRDSAARGAINIRRHSHPPLLEEYCPYPRAHHGVSDGRWCAIRYRARAPRATTCAVEGPHCDARLTDLMLLCGSLPTRLSDEPVADPCQFAPKCFFFSPLSPISVSLLHNWKIDGPTWPTRCCTAISIDERPPRGFAVEGRVRRPALRSLERKRGKRDYAIVLLLAT